MTDQSDRAPHLLDHWRSAPVAPCPLGILVSVGKQQAGHVVR